jgi:hypothetical protein
MGSGFIRFSEKWLQPSSEAVSGKIVYTLKPKEGTPADADTFTQTARPEANEFGHTVAA